MKNSMRKLVIILFLIVSPLVINTVLADDPPAPGGSPVLGGGGAGPVGGQPGGNSPIDGGLSIFIALGLAYGSKKVYQIRKVKEVI